MHGVYGVIFSAPSFYILEYINLFQATEVKKGKRSHSPGTSSTSHPMESVKKPKTDKTSNFITSQLVTE